ARAHWRECEIFHGWRSRAATDSSRSAAALHVYYVQSPHVLALCKTGYPVGGSTQGKKGGCFQFRERPGLAAERCVEEAWSRRRPRGCHFADGRGNRALLGFPSGRRA